MTKTLPDCDGSSDSVSGPRGGKHCVQGTENGTENGTDMARLSP